MPIQLTVNGSAANAVNEKSTANLEFDLQDVDGSAIAAVNLETAKLWLTVKGTQTVINLRDGTDVKGNFNDQGHFLFVLTPDDNQILSTVGALSQEIHLITIKLTTREPDAKTFTEQLTFKVQNLEQIPEA